MIAKESVSDQDLRNKVQEVCQTHLPFQADGYKCNTEMVYDVLLKAAAEETSIEAACQDLGNVVDGNTIRSVLNDQLDIKDVRTHEQQLNESFAFYLPRQIRTKKVEVAIDFHEEPFYGKNEDLRAVACRSKAAKGTTRFITTASAYVAHRQLRITLAVTFVLPEDSVLDVVQRLIARLQALKLRLKVIYFDKGFCTCKVIRYLQREKLPAVLACSIRGKDGGSRALCRGRKSYRTSYTFTDGTTADVAVVASLPVGKNGKRRRKWLLFVVINLDWSAHTVYRRYRRRFGIECSYRIGRRVRIITTSLNPMMRFFSFGFALLIVTIWAVLRWFIARVPGRGPHRVDPKHFQFNSFICLLRRAIEQLQGAIRSVPIRCPTQISIY